MKKPDTFKAAYDIAHALEATRNTAREINIGPQPTYPEATNKLGYEKPKTKKQSFSRQRSPPSNRNSAGGSSSCNGCGEQHQRSQCRFRNATCHACNKKGHIASVCRSGNSSSTDQVKTHEEPAAEIDLVQSLSQVHNVPSTDKKMLDVEIDGRRLQMELDTGAP